MNGAFNNAGSLGEMGASNTLSLEGWHGTSIANLTSAMLAARAQVPAMTNQGGGSIVFTGTFVGHTTGMPGMTAYAASKAGLLGLVKVLAVEQVAAKVRVNTVLPGGVDTPMGRSMANSSEAFWLLWNVCTQ